ncbi:hypothetical protein PYCC9005_002649 [Savitreella phatthalungensis]
MTNKIVGLTLAILSGFFIGVSFVFKKKGLLAATAKSGLAAGEGHAYLRNWMWWLGMTLMIIGEICNFVAYAFTEAILVTPLGALSVVVSAIGSSIFLKERLSFIGKVGCFLCILGAVVIVLNAPEHTSVSTIQEMQKYAISKVFLPYVGIILVIAAVMIFYVGPRYGNKHMLVYITICSIVGGVSVVCTQGFGASVVSAIGGTPNQWNQWFLWVLLIFVVFTLLVEINYLNKALNIFNTSVVTPVYFTYFTTMTLISSVILFQGLNGTGVQIATVVMGFLTIVAGVVLLQVALAAQDKPDSQVMKSELDDIPEVLAMPTEDDTLEPGAASIRGTLSLRRLATRKTSQAGSIAVLKRRQTISSRNVSRGFASSMQSVFQAPGANPNDSSPFWTVGDRSRTWGPNDSNALPLHNRTMLSPGEKDTPIRLVTRDRSTRFPQPPPKSYRNNDLYGMSQSDSKLEDPHRPDLAHRRASSDLNEYRSSFDYLGTDAEGVDLADESTIQDIPMRTRVQPNARSDVSQPPLDEAAIYHAAGGHANDELVYVSPSRLPTSSTSQDHQQQPRHIRMQTASGHIYMYEQRERSSASSSLRRGVGTSASAPADDDNAGDTRRHTAVRKFSDAVKKQFSFTAKPAHHGLYIPPATPSSAPSRHLGLPAHASTPRPDRREDVEGGEMTEEEIVGLVPKGHDRRPSKY